MQNNLLKILRMPLKLCVVFNGSKGLIYIEGKYWHETCINIVSEVQRTFLLPISYCLPKATTLDAISSLISAPAAATNLKVTNTTTGRLSFSWTTSQGELDKYEIFLYNPDQSLQDRTSGDQNLKQYSFQNLVQGRLYKMVIVTHSGKLTNESSIFGRTGKSI